MESSGSLQQLLSSSFESTPSFKQYLLGLGVDAGLVCHGDGGGRYRMEGTSLVGEQGYTQYWSGTLPLVISVPHGGNVKPQDMPDRKGQCYQKCRKKGSQTCTCKISTRKDLFTQELAALITRELQELTGSRPHVVFNHLYRGKMDANRSLPEATLFAPQAMRAWAEYHNLLSLACRRVRQQHGAGVLIDLHGQCHKHDMIELGYCISADQLIRTARAQQTLENTDSSIRELSNRSGNNLEELVRGDSSMGGLLEEKGFRVVPSPGNPVPEAQNNSTDSRSSNYYAGGFIAHTHGSQAEAQKRSSMQYLDAIQIEVPKSLRCKDKSENFVKSLCSSLVTFLREHYSL